MLGPNSVVSHPIPAATTNSAKARAASRKRPRSRAGILPARPPRLAHAMARSEKAASQNANTRTPFPGQGRGTGPRGGGRLKLDWVVVATVIIAVTGPPLTMTPGGENVHVAARGKLLHPSRTTPLNPLVGVMVTV